MQATADIHTIREPYLFYRPIMQVPCNIYAERADEAIRQLSVHFKSTLESQPALKGLIEDAVRAYIFSFAQGGLAGAYLINGDTIEEDNLKRNALVTYQFETRLLDYMAAAEASTTEKNSAIMAGPPPTAMLGRVIKTCIQCYDPDARRRFVEPDYRHLAELALHEMNVTIPGRRPPRNEEGLLEQRWKKRQQGGR